jgi:hypothetical protein
MRPSLSALPAVGDRTQFLLASRQGDAVRVLARQHTSACADLAGFDTLARRDPAAPALGALSPAPCLALAAPPSQGRQVTATPRRMVGGRAFR